MDWGSGETETTVDPKSAALVDFNLYFDKKLTVFLLEVETAGGNEEWRNAWDGLLGFPGTGRK